jgi:CheY-like chemotaxis protein
MKRPQILLVEDDPDDRGLLLDAFRNASAEVDTVVAENGLQAMDYLAAAQSGGNSPGLIVLDLNMPYLDGRATFEKIRRDNTLQDIPVIIFSSSHNPYDMAFFQDAGAEFISKPMDYKLLSGIAGHMVQVCCTSCSR